MNKMSLGAALCALIPTVAVAAEFTYNPPGKLVSGSGIGREDYNVYSPNMRFPIEVAPAYPNSQVWGRGGASGPGGSQCDVQNYSYPWWDNYCESRSWEMPLCPSGKGHQGQDIRPSTCVKDVHWVVSSEPGEVTSIGTYSVVVAAPNGTQYRYLHMEPSSLVVKVGDTVQQGQRLGRVSNAFGGTPTTIHLHYDIIQNVAGVGMVFVPPYMSLVRSYERLLGIPQEPCQQIPASGATLDNSGACFTLGGNTSTWRDERVDGAVGGSLRWTYGFEAAQPDGTARWALRFAQAGRYRLEASVIPSHGQSQRARYGVRHDGQDEEVRVNMTGPAGWRVIGEFDFAAGEDQYVELRDNTGDPLTARVRIMADAIRISPVVAQPEDMGADMGGQPDMPPPVDMGASQPDVAAEPDQGGQPDMRAGQPDMRDSDDTTQTAETSSCAQSGSTGRPQGIASLGLLAAAALVWRRRRSIVD
jgi:MYXO-CTERM domain-containing protein